ANKSSETKSFRSFLTDLKYLVKSIVLIANVLPAVGGFWLALYFTETSFVDVWDLFILMLLGSIFIVAGALILNNWYEVDLDIKMARTKRRPTVTGNMSMNFILSLGIISSIFGMVLMLMVNLETAIYAFLGWF